MTENVGINFVSRWILPNQFEKSIVGDVVLITGGGSGIGRLMAVKLAKLGAIIVTWDVNQAGNEETVRFVVKNGRTLNAASIRKRIVNRKLSV